MPSDHMIYIVHVGLDKGWTGAPFNSMCFDWSKVRAICIFSQLFIGLNCLSWEMTYVHNLMCLSVCVEWIPIYRIDLLLNICNLYK